MFARSRYNWATSQVETCLKFDFGLANFQIDLAKFILEDDAFFRDCERIKKELDCNWYFAVAYVAKDALAKLSDSVERPLRLGIIYAAAGGMVMTKELGVPHAQAWIKEQLETFSTQNDGEAENSSDSNALPPDEESPFPFAMRLAARKFDWGGDDSDRYSTDAHEWTQEGAYEIATAFGLDNDDFDHVPWELHPMLQAAIHIARHECVKAIMEEMREQREELGNELQDLNVLILMMLETSELDAASKYLDIVEATYETLDLEWEDKFRGNAHFFAANLAKVGMPEEYIREEMISLARSMYNDSQA